MPLSQIIQNDFFGKISKFLEIPVSILIILVFIMFSILLPSNPVSAQQECTERRLRDLGVAIINCVGDTGPMCGEGPTTITPSLRLGSRIYLLGDSILDASRTIVDRELVDAGFAVSAINADVGRAVSSDTAGGEPTGLESVVADTTIIAGSEGVVIELGTYSGNEDLNVQIPALITAVRTTGFTGPIFWMNLFYTANGGPSANNSIITTQAALQNYSVIDTTSAEIELQADGILPTTDGNLTFTTRLVNGLLASVGTAPTASGVFDPISLNFPNFPNETTIASSITSYIQENFPSSPWLEVGGNIGTWLVAESKARNINPLLIASIGKQENRFGDSSSVHVTQYYNYFGMKGDGPVDVPGSTYRGFSSPLTGITFFLDKVRENIQGPDRGYYTEVVNFYDYLGMHQAGQIKYPGEPLGNQGPTGQDGYDPAMDVYVSWTTTDHPNNRYDGQLFNPGIYYTNSINFINELLGTSLSDTPVRGPTSAGSGADCGAAGNVSVNGYAFPLAPQTKRQYSTLPCTEVTCHHDGTAAFDLSYDGVAGQSVYAIIGGTIDNVGTQEEGFCQSVQLAGSDGFYYWYGHLIGVAVAEGETVQVGQEIAKVADWTEEHTCASTSDGDHLHIDRGCTLGGMPQRGGTDACRDFSFIPLLNAIYETLPVNSGSSL